MDNEAPAAVILAAGYSSRMGAFKPLLDFEGKTAVRRVIESFQAAGVGDIKVVVGYRADELNVELAGLNVQSIKNPRFDLGMFTSIQCGIKSLDKSVDSFFLLPTDIPIIRPATISKLIDAGKSDAAKVVYPTFADRRGHPPLIRRECAQEILAAPAEGNLRAILEKREADSMEVACADASVLMDMDTQEDYRRLQKRLRYRDIPSPEEIDALLNLHGVSEQVMSHGRAVAEFGKNIVEILNTKGGAKLDPDLIVAAGILHDIAKGSPHHARKGADIARVEGFPRVAECVESHMDLELPEGRIVDLREKDILYLSDKLIEEDRFVPIEERFRVASKRAETDPWIGENVERRKRTALILMAEVESRLNPRDRNLLPWMARHE